MNARLEELEAEVATPESVIDVRLKHIENDVAEIKTDLRSNAAEIKSVRDDVAQLHVQLEVRTRELGDAISAQGKELREMIVAQGKELREAITAQGAEIKTELQSNAAGITALRDSVARLGERSEVSRWRASNDRFETCMTVLMTALLCSMTFIFLIDFTR